MSALAPYLQRKAEVLAQRRAHFQEQPEAALVRLKATSYVAGNTGVRPVKMGDYIVISDSAPGLAGHSLGPSSPEMLLGALASCLVHTYLLQATLLTLPLDHVELEGLSYTPTVTSSASVAEIEQLHAAVEQACAVLNTLRSPMEVTRKG